MANTGDIRNIVLLGHGSSGKTSLAEAILHKTGATNRLGSVDEKSSVCGYCGFPLTTTLQRLTNGLQHEMII